MVPTLRRARGLCSSEVVLLVITTAKLLGVTLGAPAGDLVTKLPGQPDVSFKQYSGYITVDEDHGRNLFYYFVESPIDPQTKPVALWLNGGPGCSSLGNGAFEELGPFYPNKNGTGLILNRESWIREANIVFLESPAGVGFSYSNVTSDYNTDDNKTANDSLTFLLKWFALYPEFQASDFYITGESYAGHYVPQLAAAILESNKVATTELKIQLKAVLVGNPLFDHITDLYYAPIEYAWSHGMVSKRTYDILLQECKFNATEVENPACNNAVLEALFNESTLYAPDTSINSYDVLEDVCVGSTAQQSLRLMEFHTGEKLGVDPCIEDQGYKYLNLKSVQSALHVKPTQWFMCSGLLNYSLSSTTGFNTLISPLLAKLAKEGLRIWVFSGDADAVVPFIGTQQIINSLAEDLNLNITSSYRPWFQGQQVGGWAISWGSLSFITVRGAGHMVPATQPSRALQLFTSFITGTSLPPKPLA